MESMTSMKRMLVLAMCAALALPAALAPSSAWGAGAAPLEGWTRVRYTTSKLLVFSGELTMDRTTSADKVSVRTETRARLFGSPFVDNWSVSTMDRKTGRPLDFFDVRPKKKAERFTFGATGILHETLKPRKETPNDPMDKWRSKKETLPVESAPAPPPAATPKSTPASNGGGPVASAAPTTDPAVVDPSRWVHDYIAMIVRLHDLPLRKVGDEARVSVLTSKGAAPMRIRVAEERSVRRDLTDLATGKPTSATFRELRLRVTPLAGSPSDTKGFMNMEGETELWVDAATRTLMEISGEVPKVPGRVDIVIAGYRK